MGQAFKLLKLEDKEATECPLFSGYTSIYRYVKSIINNDFSCGLLTFLIISVNETENAVKLYRAMETRTNSLDEISLPCDRNVFEFVCILNSEIISDVFCMFLIY